MDVTPRELVIAQIDHRETDRIPYTIRFDGGTAEQLDEYYGDRAWRQLIDNAIYRLPAPPAAIVDPRKRTDRYYLDPYGTTWRIDRRPFHLVEAPLSKPSLEGFSFPGVDSFFESSWEEEAREAIEREKDRFLVIGLGPGLFERSWALRGFEEALMDSVAHTDFYWTLIAEIAKHQIGIIQRLVELPVDGILFADDWGYQEGVLIGPDRWRQLLKPHLARQYQCVHGAGKYVLTHCCGSIAAILPDLIEIGLDVYQSVQPEAKDNDPYELKRKFGSKITFWGGLGSQSTIPFGTPAEIREEVARLCREMAKGGGFVLAPAKPIQPGTPVENAVAVLESFLEASASSTMPALRGRSHPA